MLLKTIVIAIVILAAYWFIWKQAARNLFIDGLMAERDHKYRIRDYSFAIMKKRQQIEEELRAEGHIFQHLIIPTEKLIEDLPGTADAFEVAEALRTSD